MAAVVVLVFGLVRKGRQIHVNAGVHMHEGGQRVHLSYLNTDIMRLNTHTHRSS